MKKSKSFYIGWQNEMPKENSSIIKKLIISIFVVLPLLAFGIVHSQKGFVNHQFELGKLTELTGIYHSYPVPILEVTQEDLKEGLSRDVLLVGYGKFGAEGIMSEIQSSEGELEGKHVTLLGTLIYGDGKTIMELTKKKKSLISINENAVVETEEVEALQTVTLTGEILDPKCYFGVMKPGEGKIHKSCAIRCISGGIPPVFRSISAQGDNQYYILLGEDGEKINKQILDMVAEQVVIKGTTTTMNGWDCIYASKIAI